METNLTIEVVRKIVTSLFEDKPKWDRSDIVKEVERIHNERGGVITAKSATYSVKKVLADMKKKQSITNIGKGLWAKNIVSVEGTLVAVKTIGIPLQPVYARKLILELLADKKTWQRMDLAKNFKQIILKRETSWEPKIPSSLPKKLLLIYKMLAMLSLTVEGIGV